jgi:hypothetical protein
MYTGVHHSGDRRDLATASKTSSCGAATSYLVYEHVRLVECVRDAPRGCRCGELEHELRQRVGWRAGAACVSLLADVAHEFCRGERLRETEAVDCSGGRKRREPFEECLGFSGGSDRHAIATVAGSEWN